MSTINRTDTGRTESTETKSARDDHAPKFDDVRKDIRNVRDGVQNLATDAAGLAKETANAATETVSEGAKKLAHEGQMAHQKMCEFVSSRPTASILLAIGAGALIGRIFTFRR